MNKEEILNYVKNHASGKVKVAITDIDGVLRGKYISAEKFFSVAESDMGFCDVVFGWDMNDAAYDNATFAGWHTGYGDAKVKIDLTTFRKIPWENDLPFFLGEFYKTDNEPLSICPRQLLKKTIKKAENMGYEPIFSQEFEWFNFAETLQTANDKKYQDLTPLTPGMFGYSILRSTFRNDYFAEIFELLTKFNIPIEGLHTETGPGVYEAAIQYCDAISAGDKAVIFKTAVKEIAYKHGIMATFMAKYSESLPGNGGHIHQSLWDVNEKKNLFFDGNDIHKMSKTMKSYLAGQLMCLPHILPMYAPTINSYKRLVEGAWAPTTRTWGIDNRTVGLRAIIGGEKSIRIENRVVGADCNPYLAMVACLASGIYGIENNMELTQLASTGNGYKDFSNGVLPKSLESANEIMQNSEIAGQLFDQQFITHFTQTRTWECRQYAKAVTDWEKKRYFEII